MRNISTVGIWAFAICGSIFPIVLRAQTFSSQPMTEEQSMGKGLFLQNCSACHFPEGKGKNTKKEATSVGPRLDLLMKSQPLPDDVIRGFMINGSEGKMPSFKYDLQPKEMDAIIAYIKTF